jgi:hypothetical protein
MRMQVRSILGQTRPDRQTLLFSATMPTRVERLVRDALTSPVRITVGEVGAANEDVRQARPRALGNLPGVQRFGRGVRLADTGACWAGVARLSSGKGAE